MTKELNLSTTGKTSFIDITNQVERVVRDSSVKNGICTVFVPHTTAGVTINENADPSVQSDIINSLGKIVPERGNYSHMEGNSPAHVKASLVGMSETIFVKNGSLFLGTWQGIYFCEFDGPRKRKFLVKVLEE